MDNLGIGSIIGDNLRRVLEPDGMPDFVQQRPIIDRAILA